MRLVPSRKHLMWILAATLLSIAAPQVLAGANELSGRWMLTITIPDSPGSSTNREIVVTMDVSPRRDSLHGRAAITDSSGRTVSAAWRQVGKSASIAYELPCPGDVQCASLILQGKVKGGGVLIKKGNVIVVWDTTNNRNPALYDTSNGKFRGDRIE